MKRIEKYPSCFLVSCSVVLLLHVEVQDVLLELEEEVVYMLSAGLF